MKKLSKPTKLLSARKRSGMKQVELASAAAVSQSQLWSYEKGYFLPTRSVAKRLAKALNCRVEDIFGPQALKDRN